MKNDIFISESKNPYYIYTPSYTRLSAGIKVLHLLCHHLNTKGYPAFLVKNKRNYKVNLDLVTPILDNITFEKHIDGGKNPIVIYPDIIVGNPLNADCVVRYLLHYAGFLGGDKVFSEKEMVFSYTKKIAIKSTTDDSKILFMPISDVEIFYPPQDDLNRSGSCFYASKYKALGGKLFDVTNNSIEIVRDSPTAQSTEEVAELLRRSKVFYAYEDTSLITEAILCGCPVVLLKNDFFSAANLAEYELGLEGCTVDNTEQGIGGAKKGIKISLQKFTKARENFWSQLDGFIKDTQEYSNKKVGSNKMKMPNHKERINIGRSIKKLIKTLF